MHIGVDVKARIMEEIKAAIKEFECRPKVKTKFGEPLVGYANCASPVFDMFHVKKLCEHPKKIYRPGRTVIVHFVPYAQEVIESNKGGEEPSEQWKKAYEDGMWLSMRLNGVIREVLDTQGRLCSCTNTPSDWDEELCREEWSHKMAAYAAGMGEFGPAGCLITENGYAGRFGAVITDGNYGEAAEPMNNEQLEELYREIMRRYAYREADGARVTEEMIAACPAGAITAEGIDRKLCQEHCRKVSRFIPSPETCGKCFPYGK